MIDFNKKYKTRSGRDVKLLDYVPIISATGAKATFPIKGSIVMSNKPYKTKYSIWKENGRYDVFKEHPFDLIEVTE